MRDAGTSDAGMEVGMRDGAGGASVSLSMSGVGVSACGERPKWLALSGPMGAGKSTVGAQLASELGIPMWDLDVLVEKRAGCSVAEVFAREGEDGFRRLESRCLEDLLRDEAGGVLCLGGGAVLAAGNRLLLWSHAFVVTLMASPLVLARRLASAREGRPLLASWASAGSNDHHASEGTEEASLVQALKRMLAQRREAYAECHACVETDGKPIEDIAAELKGAWTLADILVPLGSRSYRIAFVREPMPSAEAGTQRALLREGLQAGLRGEARDGRNLPQAGQAVAAGSSEAGRSTDGDDRLRASVARHAASSQVLVVSDRNVMAHHGATIEALLRPFGQRVSYLVLEPGEQHKNMSAVGSVWEAALAVGADRDALVLAFGGGVVGDIAGFAASTLFRGVAFAQVPTSLLAMVDSSVGGKTGVDLPAGKNLVGAFHQPAFVHCDLRWLRTLPLREYRAGLAEVVKVAWIAGERAVQQLERDADALGSQEEEALERTVRMAVGLKSAVVQADERESGLRMLLNFGHTLGHALETACGFGNLLHGEAVSLGMVAACHVAEQREGASAAQRMRLVALLERLGLPVDVLPRLTPEVLAFVGADKKRAGDGVRFVLPLVPGEFRVRRIALREMSSLFST